MAKYLDVHITKMLELIMEHPNISEPDIRKTINRDSIVNVSQQGFHYRLQEMIEEGYVEVSYKKGTNIYNITEKGRNRYELKKKVVYSEGNKYLNYLKEVAGLFPKDEK